jgi:hypothetical protein
MNHLVAENIGGDPNNLGWPPGQQRYFLYALALSCAWGLALWNSLSPAQKIAQSQPMPRPGNFQLRTCDDGGYNPGNPSGELEEEIQFTGQNVSDAPSTNPSLMTLTPRVENGEIRITMTFTQPPAAGEERWLLYNNLRWFRQSEIEARGFAFGREHLFQCFDFVGAPAGEKRLDTRPNAEQRITFF